ncbi:hypothetical protein WR25_07937 [Diploscapter pachys]|uniref:Uncharacterized protein n=1 Tax=Diploscapter pachys TaxID=2018661 RepID=A0A2A2KKH9_9BILA|nr:hypothetical protein WR25_07937 [Diploscapter pachys]
MIHVRARAILCDVAQDKVAHFLKGSWTDLRTRSLYGRKAVSGGIDGNESLHCRMIDEANYRECDWDCSGTTASWRQASERQMEQRAFPSFLSLSLSLTFYPFLPFFLSLSQPSVNTRPTRYTRPQ